MDFEIIGEITNLETQFVVCVKNKDYPASLELRKIYQVIPDARATDVEEAIVFADERIHIQEARMSLLA